MKLILTSILLFVMFSNMDYFILQEGDIKMSALKNKLAEKVDFIEAETIMPNNNEIQDNSAQITTHKDNVIMLKQSENSIIQSVVPDFAITLNDARERISMLQSFVKEMMVQNVDYGVIPHCDKPSLFKPGAEKLCDIFGFSKKIEISNRIEDWEKGLFHYEVKVILVNKRTGMIEAECIGACNSRERKYKSQDSFSIINVLIKMAKKRALIDAVLSATRSSGIFTQDIEDLIETQPLKSQISSKESSKIIKDKSTNHFASNKQSLKVQPINKHQHNQLISIVTKQKISIEEVKEIMLQRYNVSESKNLNFEQAQDFIQYLGFYIGL